MASMYPKALSYFVNRITNYSQTTVKSLPYLVDNVKSTESVIVDLLPNALIDLRTLAFHFKLTTTTAGASNFACAPQNIESLIDKITLEFDGKSLNSGANQSYVFNSLLPLMGGTDLVNKRAIYQNGGPVVASTANETNQPYVISHWMGFLGSAMPEILDTTALGNVRITIQLANTNVLVPTIGTANTYTQDYSLGGLYFTYNTLSIKDDVFYPLHKEYLASGAIYEIPFDNYHTSLFATSTWDNTLRFSIKTQSLDWLGAINVKNYNKALPLDTNSKRGAMFNTSLVGCADYSFDVAGTQFPQFKAKPDEVFTHTMNALQQTHDVSNGISPIISTRDIWKQKYAVFMQPFAFPSSADERVVSGINTQGDTVQLSFITSGDGALEAPVGGGQPEIRTPDYIILIAKTTSILRVGAQRDLEVVL